MARLAILFAAAAMLPVTASARDSLGVFDSWGAFRDPGEPRCYAIAEPATTRRERDFEPYATVATWPRRGIRGQVHFRLSRKLAAGSQVTLIVNDQHFTLTSGEGDAWATDARADAAIVAAMRSGVRMVVNARDAGGQRFSDSYDLAGVATAMDAATVGCAKL